MINLQTNSLINIYKALASFQQECPVIHKETTGHNYTYADLPTILEVINPILKKHNLGFTQLLIEDGLKTIIFHTISGEAIESNATIPQITLRGMNEYQSFGSGITYYRRYALSAALGLVTDKDTDASGEKTASIFIKKHESILDLKLAIDMCENLNELAKLHTLNKELIQIDNSINLIFTHKKSEL
jgi:hypothetical protein